MDTRLSLTRHLWWKPLHSPVVGEPYKHHAKIIKQFPSLWRAARDRKVMWGHWGRWLQGGGGQYYTQWKLLQSNRCSWCVPPDVNNEMMNKWHLIKKMKKKNCGVSFWLVIYLCSGKPPFCLLEKKKSNFWSNKCCLVLVKPMQEYSWIHIHAFKTHPIWFRNDSKICLHLLKPLILMALYLGISRSFLIV